MRKRKKLSAREELVEYGIRIVRAGLVAAERSWRHGEWTLTLIQMVDYDGFITVDLTLTPAVPRSVSSAFPLPCYWGFLSKLSRQPQEPIRPLHFIIDKTGFLVEKSRILHRASGRESVRRRQPGRIEKTSRTGIEGP